MYNNKLHFHFTGIGGSGMSGIAEVLLNLGFKVSGSDLKLGEVCSRLSELGAEIHEGHSSSFLSKDVSLLVYSSAVTLENPEVCEAKVRGIPIVPRSDVLAELMRLKYGIAVAGSHGKTTTTSMIAAVLEQGGLDPTAIIGGRVKQFGTGGKLGKGNFLVAESDESDRSFLRLRPTISVVTNIDAEHLSAYDGIGDLQNSFKSFVNSVPFYGVTVLCIDDPRVRKLSEEHERRVISYGFSPDARIRAESLSFKGRISHFKVFDGDKFLGDFNLGMPGRHFVQNSLAAIAVGIELEIPLDSIQEALSNFEGVARRLEIIGERKGITVISDYAHHPVEIRATISATRAGWTDASKVIAVFQPHRYSRTKESFAGFLECFGEADSVILSDIYPAGENPIEGITGEKLFDAMLHPQKSYQASLSSACEEAILQAERGAVILCLGAGPIGNLPEMILSSLESSS